MNGGETSFDHLYDRYVSTFLASNEANKNPYLVINFMKPVPVQGVWIQTNSAVMNSGAFDVRVANTIDLLSPTVVCPGSAEKGIGVNSQSGAFNCGLTGSYFIINCFGGCKMQIQTLYLWPKQILSLDADVTLAEGNKFRTGYDTYKNLNNLVGVGSVPCTNTATSIAVERGTITRTAVIVDMKYSIETQYTMIQQLGTTSTTGVRVYVNNKPWHDNVASTSGDNIIVHKDELDKISDNPN